MSTFSPRSLHCRLLSIPGQGASTIQKYPPGYPSQLPGEYRAARKQPGTTAYKFNLTITQLLLGREENCSVKILAQRHTEPKHQQSPTLPLDQLAAAWHACICILVAGKSVHYRDVIMGAMASQIIVPYYCLLNRLFGRRSMKTSKLRVTGLCAGNLPMTGEFPAQMANNAENVSIWWRHHCCSSQIKRSLFLFNVFIYVYVI